MSLTSDQITAQNFKDFYQQILPYLGKEVPTIGIGGGYAPIGTIISYMGTTAPQDYLICDGTTYNIADYKQLADFFAAQFGSSNFFGGDGVTTFKVPDLRGEFLRGTGTNTHADQGSGDNVGVHQDGSLMPISIGYCSNAQFGIRGIPDGGNNIAVKKTDYITKTDGKEVHVNTNVMTVQDKTNANLYYTARPTNTSVLYCIKAVVAGDVYSTDERVVGTWIDGKPIYQKTFELNDLEISYNSFTDTGISAVTFDTIISCFSIDLNGSYSGTLLTSHYGSGSAHSTITCQTTRNGAVIYSRYLTIQYTKTTD